MSRVIPGDALQITAAGVSGAVGEAFFPWLVRHLAETCGTAYAFIGEIADEAAETVRTVAVQVHGEPADNFEYELRGAPCEFVVGREAAVHERGV